jgi:hypothetical protein
MRLELSASRDPLRSQSLIKVVVKSAVTDTVMRSAGKRGRRGLTRNTISRAVSNTIVTEIETRSVHMLTHKGDQRWVRYDLDVCSDG